MVKVVNVISDTNIGGAGKCVINFAKNYDKEKYDISVILPKDSALIEELKKTTVKIIEIDGLKDKSWDFGSLFKLIRVLKKEKPDIVHTHASSTARLAAKFVKGARIIYTRHSAFPVSNRIKKNPGRFFYKHINESLADRIIAVGNAAEENLTDGGIDKGKIDTFFNGVEKVNIISDAEKQKLKKKYKIGDNEAVVGIIARLEEVKGQDDFIEAVKILKEENKLKAKYLILGTGSEEERLKKKVKELKLDDSVIFTGFVKNVGDFLNIMDVQVNCSFGTETSSLSLLEGMSLGIPAVASDYGGNPYLIKDGENGYIVPTHSPKKYAEAIYKILSDSEIRKHMNKKALQIYEEKYTIQTYVNNIQGVYEKVLKQEKKRKINILDIFIIIIALTIVLFGYKYLKNGKNSAGNASEKIVYKVMTTEAMPELYEMIEVNTPIYESSKNYCIGTLIDKKATKTVKSSNNLVTGESVMTELDDKIDIIFTIEANAESSIRDFTVGELKVKVGNTANVKGKGYAAEGYIIAIERNDKFEEN